MSTSDLKKIIIKRITQIDDPGYLRAVKTILDSKMDNEFLQLTKEQLDDIAQSDRDIKKGEYLDHDLLMKEVKKWLSVR